MTVQESSNDSNGGAIVGGDVNTKGGNFIGRDNVQGGEIHIYNPSDPAEIRTQKQFEDALARQNKIIEAQGQFLEHFSKLLWEFHALIAKVTYYKSYAETGVKDETARFHAALESYEENFWNVVIINIQSDISKARRFVSPQAHTELVNFYTHTINKLDQHLTTLLRDHASTEAWSEFHNQELKGRFVPEIDRILFMLAQDMGLVIEKRGNES